MLVDTVKPWFYAKRVLRLELIILIEYSQYRVNSKIPYTSSSIYVDPLKLGIVIFGSDRSPMSHNVRSFVRSFGSSLSRALILHLSSSNLQAISQQ